MSSTSKRIIFVGAVVVLVAGLFWAQSMRQTSNKEAPAGSLGEDLPTPKAQPAGKNSAPLLRVEQYYTSGDIVIESIDHQKRNFTEGKPFTRYQGDAFGLDKHNNLSLLEFFDPFWMGRSIASGDYNNDSWQDVMLATNEGILIYKNLGTNTFVREDVSLSGISDLGFLLAAFVDIDSDGWQDIYVTSFGGKNYFLLNNKGSFRGAEILQAPGEEALMTEAVSFADVDRDGDLDFVNGNWFFHQLLADSFPSKKRLEVNKIVINDNGEFRDKSLTGVIGPTLAILLSDFTNDNTPDLIVGNDFDAPDIFYVGEEKGVLVEVKKTDGIIPVSAHNTMSVDVADFNNDLYMDIYMTAIGSTEGTAKIDRCFEISNIEEKRTCQHNFRIKEAVKNFDCSEFTSTQDKNDCTVMGTLHRAIESEDEKICEKIPGEYQAQKLICQSYFAINYEMPNYEESIEQVPSGNVLLQGSYEGVFEEVAKKMGVDDTFWSWNGKFADLDNDEWQDIYVANGFFDKDSIIQSNVFFHNQQGQYFDARHMGFGLENFNAVSAYTYLDIDNDGDLDVITVAVNGPLHVYVNNEYQNNSIAFEFRDDKGNHWGIGNKIYIFYGENDERHQVREIKSGGGFLSFDSPVAHFGLGKFDRVNKVEIIWSTGETTILEKEFLANKKYVVTRHR